MLRIALAVVATMMAGAALAQPAVQPPMAAPPLVDWSKIEIKATDLGNKTWMLTGQGGNITIAVGSDAIIMVDGQFAPLSDKIKAAIKAISPLPIRYLVNTHFHGDHTGGNENFAKDGATIVAHDNIRVRLAAGTVSNMTGVKAPPRSADWLPKQTYVVGSFAVEAGGRKAQLTHIANAHTDGDTWVYFADANVLATGDTFNNLKRYQNIDYLNGGDVRGMIRALDTYIKAVERHDQDRARPRPACHQGGPDGVPRHAGDLARPHQEALRRGQERGRSHCRKAARRSRRDLGQQSRARGGPHQECLQLVQAAVGEIDRSVGMTDGKALRGADIVARSLARLGCDRVFTLSGNHIMSIFDAAIEAKLDLVHVRHEAAAVHMADAWGRLTGKPGIAMVTGGPGHANAVGALYTALGAESPMVLLSGHAATWELGRGGFQEIRQADMAAPVSKASFTATSAATLGRDVGEAIRIATSGRPGPVHLSLPSDLLEERVESNAIVWPDARPAAVPALSDAVADATLAAIAVRGAADHLRGAAAFQRERARAARAARSRDAGARRHPGKPARHRGCDARRILRSGAPRRPDRAARQGARFHHQVGERLVVRSGGAADLDRSRGRAGRARREGDGRAARAGQHRGRARRGRNADRRAAAMKPRDGGWLKEARAALDNRPAAWASIASQTPGRLHPAQVFRVLRPYVERDPDTVLICDGGEFAQWGQSMLPVRRRMINGVGGSIGGSLSFANAARLAEPKAPIFVVLGDGTIGFHLSEFETAVRRKLPFVAVLGNDALWNAESQIQLREYGTRAHARLRSDARALRSRGRGARRPRRIRRARRRFARRDRARARQRQARLHQRDDREHRGAGHPRVFLTRGASPRRHLVQSSAATSSFTHARNARTTGRSRSCFGQTK